MVDVSLESIKSNSQKRISTLNGDVLHVLKCSDIDFKKFGEIYFSWIEKGSIKAWKKHKRMTMNIVVPFGKVKFVFFDEDSQTYRNEEIGEDNYLRLTIPPGLWFGFKDMTENRSLITNIADIEHDDNEVERLDINEIKYDWNN